MYWSTRMGGRRDACTTMNNGLTQPDRSGGLSCEKPPMSDVIDELLARPDVTTSDPAAGSDIHAVSGYFDGRIPELLLKLWRASDGVVLEPLNAHLLGPSDVSQFLADCPSG